MAAGVIPRSLVKSTIPWRMRPRLERVSVLRKASVLQCGPCTPRRSPAWSRRPGDAVYRALLDPAAIARWRVPDGMRGEVHELDARVGGRIRMSLTYDDPTSAGKSERCDRHVRRPVRRAGRGRAGGGGDRVRVRRPRAARPDDDDHHAPRRRRRHRGRDPPRRHPRRRTCPPTTRPAPGWRWTSWPGWLDSAMSPRPHRRRRDPDRAAGQHRVGQPQRAGDRRRRRGRAPSARPPHGQPARQHRGRPHRPRPRRAGGDRRPPRHGAGQRQPARPAATAACCTDSAPAT